MNYDPLVPCGYDSSHLILRSRLIYHHGRCSKNFPNSKKQKCPFDATHVIDELEFPHHISNCSGRETIIHFERRDIDDNLNLVKIEKHVMDELGSWDQDDVAFSYNPYENCKNRPVLRRLMAASKSEKKRFQYLERQRFQRLDNETYQMDYYEKNDAKSKINNNLENFESNDDDAADCAKPLRPPIRFLLNKSLLDESNSEEQVSMSAEQVVQEREEILEAEKQPNSNIIEESLQQIEDEPFNSEVVIHENKEKCINDIDHNMTPKIKRSSVLKRSSDYDKIYELVKTVEKITIHDDELRKLSEPLIKRIKMLRLNSPEREL